MTRFRTDGVENLMKMEEFDDVKQIAEEIDKMEDQVQELCKRCSACLTSVDKMGKDQLAEELQQKINTSTEMKASIQALHLKVEQAKLPPEITFVLCMAVTG